MSSALSAQFSPDFESPGLNQRARALAIFDDGGFGNGQPSRALGGFAGSLFAGGYFSTIYGKRSAGVGEYRIETKIFEDSFEAGDTSAWSLP